MSRDKREEREASLLEQLLKQEWNEAIERAAKCVGYKDQALADIVRELKK